VREEGDAEEDERRVMRSLNVDEIETANTVLQVILAWRAFKKTHNLADAKVCCCNHTRHLFNQLDELERDLIADETREPGGPAA
jgi:hypothetical protein